MEIFNAVIKNGTTLNELFRVALDPYKIVWMKKWSDETYTNCAHLLYCRNTDRREPCDDLYLTATYADTLSMLQLLDVSWFKEYTVYIGNLGDGIWTGQEEQVYNDFFIEDVFAYNENGSTVDINYNGTMTPVACLKYCEGAFKRKKVYVDPADIPDLLVTTTTEEPVVTTTTEGGPQ